MLTRILLIALLLLPLTAIADIVSSSSTHYVLRHEANTTLSADELWDRLVDPAAWWHPDHTYSGSADNLSLDLKPGGLWLETWESGAVSHGEVLLMQDKRILRLNAPFGPLQGVGAHVIWTITIEEKETGAMVIFDESATAPPTAKLDELAPAVDFVKTEAIRRLTVGAGIAE